MTNIEGPGPEEHANKPKWDQPPSNGEGPGGHVPENDPHHQQQS